MSDLLIQDPAALQRLCARLRAGSWVALDTEFIREKTYYARLGLIQVATPDVVVCVDPLAVDIEPLLDVLYAPAILKVIHAARQDLEVFHDRRGAIPTPVFDTQIAAALVGLSEQVGYAALVHTLTGTTLAKLHTRDDWSARPLSEEQLGYAADDVRYLREVYLDLHQQLEVRGRSRWLEEECAAVADPARYGAKPAEAYRRFKGASLPLAAQPLAQALLEWREKTAQREDLPRMWVLTDKALHDIARGLPADLAALHTIADLGRATVRRWGKEILGVLATSKHTPPARVWDEPPRLGADQQILYGRMRARVSEVARQQGISAGLIAGRRDLEQLLLAGDGVLTRGWRFELVGRELSSWKSELSNHALPN